ncbi:MAG: hypothetical protein JNM84_22835, partial [Planctomycetes bacterium]|nr:hypothetical protein [Planctomycetota bacterium]
GVLARVYDDVEQPDGTSQPLVHPVLTTVGAEAEGFGIEMNHSFATGDAALVIADALASPETYALGAEGKVRRPALDGSLYVRQGQGTPYFFGTDTSVGLGVAWNGGNVPKSVTIGYRRKELAVVPLDNQVVWRFAAWNKNYDEATIQHMESSGVRLDPLDSTHRVYQPDASDLRASALRITELKSAGLLVAYEKSKLPALIATAQASARAREIEKTGIRVGQTFATGAAATLLAQHGAVRRVLGPSLVPGWEEITAMESGSVGDLAMGQQLLDIVSERARAGDPQAIALDSDLKKIVFSAADYPAFPLYLSFAPAVPGGAQATIDRDAAFADAVTDTASAISYLVNLRTSIDTLGRAQRAGALKGPLLIGDSVAGTAPALADGSLLMRIQRDFELQARLLAERSGALGSDPRIVAACKYATQQFLKRK